MSKCSICDRKVKKIAYLVGHIEGTMFHFHDFWCWECFEANVIEVLKDDSEDVKKAKEFWKKFYPLE